MGNGSFYSRGVLEGLLFHGCLCATQRESLVRHYCLDSFCFIIFCLLFWALSSASLSSSEAFRSWKVMVVGHGDTPWPHKASFLFFVCKTDTFTFG
jgi:hypothetical protein